MTAEAERGPVANQILEGTKDFIVKEKASHACVCGHADREERVSERGLKNRPLNKTHAKYSLPGYSAIAVSIVRGEEGERGR